MRKVILQLKYLKKNNVEKEKFVGGNEYLISSLDLKLKEEDVTSLLDYKKVSVFIERTRKSFT